jgi:hypothetical protein
MNVENAVVPTPEQIQGLTEKGHGKAIYMVNLLKFKEKAEYEDGRKTQLSGQEAYGIYGTEVAGHLAKVGGKFVIGGQVTGLRLGADPEYQKSAVHRAAGLAGQLNIGMVLPEG